MLSFKQKWILEVLLGKKQGKVMMVVVESQKGKGADITIVVTANMNLNVGLSTQQRFARNTCKVKSALISTVVGDILNDVNGWKRNKVAGDQIVTIFMLLLQVSMVINTVVLDVKIFGLM